MLKAILRLAALLPLRFIHAVGAALGWVVYLASPRYAARLKENLARSGLCSNRAEYRQLLRKTVAEAGRGAAELVVIWFRKASEVIGLVRECQGWDHVEVALRQGKGIIFLTPHLGCFDISALYGARRFPMTVLYRPPRLAWLRPLMLEGRQRGQVTLAATDLKGVRALYRALKRGEAVGFLPDQAPSVGEGVWADFFGRPAYTMTLAARLAESSGAAVLLAFARRLPRGRGYVLDIKPLGRELPREPQAAARALNAAIEELVRECPEQYLWSYNRYKVPAGAERPGLRSED